MKSVDDSEKVERWKSHINQLNIPDWSKVNEANI